MNIKNLVLFLILITSSISIHADTVIKAVVDEWAPFGGENLPNRGISLDVMITVLERAGYQVEAEIVPWERALSGVKNGTYDVIGNLFFDAELQSDLTFSRPFYETEVQFIQQKGGAANYSDIESLRPYSIAVGEGYLYEDNFDRADFLNKRVVTTVVQGVRMVANGRVDLTLDSSAVINHVINQEAPELADKVEFLPKALAKQEIHMAVRNNFPEKEKLLETFNSILNDMKADGSLEELLKKHEYN